jgi:hypothetical protein
MSGLFGGNKPPKQYVPASPKEADDTANNAAMAEMWRRRMAKGRESTMLTSGDAVTPVTPKKTLLGE